MDEDTFFRTLHETPQRIGFVLRGVYVTPESQGSGGWQDSLTITDQAWGDVSIELRRIRRIEIDRRGTEPPVTVHTDGQADRGDFQPSPQRYGNVHLIVTRPFVGLRDMRSEIDLRTVEYALLERTESPSA